MGNTQPQEGPQERPPSETEKFTGHLKTLQNLSGHPFNPTPNFTEATYLLDRTDGRELFADDAIKAEDFASSGVKFYCASNNAIPFLGHFTLILQFYDETQNDVGPCMKVHLTQDDSDAVSIFVRTDIVRESPVRWMPGKNTVDNIRFTQHQSKTCNWLHDEICKFANSKPEGWTYQATSWNCQNAADELCLHLFKVCAPAWSLSNTFEGLEMCGKGTFWTIGYFLFFLFFGILLMIILPSVRLSQPPNTTTWCEVIEGFSTCTVGFEDCQANMSGCYLDVKFIDPFTNITHVTRTPINQDTTNGNCDDKTYFPWTWFEVFAQWFHKSARTSPCCEIDTAANFRSFIGEDPLIRCEIDPSVPGQILFFPVQYEWKFSNFHFDVPDHVNAHLPWIISILIGSVVFFWIFFIIKFYRFIHSKCPIGCCDQNFIDADWRDEAEPSKARGIWQLCGFACLLAFFVQFMLIGLLPDAYDIYGMFESQPPQLPFIFLFFPLL